MKKFLIFSILFLSLFPVATYAQENEEQEEQFEYLKPQASVVKRNIVKEKTPIEYAEVSEENALSLQTIWRRIDCRERMNYHLYYPTEEMETRQSLPQALIDAVRNKKIKAYDDEEMKVEIDAAKILEKLGAKDETRVEDNMDGSGEQVTVHVKGFVTWKEVREYIVKEEWFIDKRHGKLDVRILAICPIRVYQRVSNSGGDSDNDNEGDSEAGKSKMQICWFYFPEARRILANTICYTGKNQTANLSFDDIFHKRYFSSYIERISNEINDREIRDYTRNGLEAILESEKIKRSLLEMESDLWNY